MNSFSRQVECGSTLHLKIEPRRKGPCATGRMTMSVWARCCAGGSGGRPSRSPGVVSPEGAEDGSRLGCA